MFYARTKSKTWSTAKRQCSPVPVDRADDRIIESKIEEIGAGRADDREDTQVAGRRRRGARQCPQILTRHIR